MTGADLDLLGQLYDSIADEPPLGGRTFCRSDGDGLYARARRLARRRLVTTHPDGPGQLFAQISDQGIAALLSRRPEAWGD